MGKSVLIPLREGAGERVDNAAQGLARPRSERHRCYFYERRHRVTAPSCLVLRVGCCPDDAAGLCIQYKVYELSGTSYGLGKSVITMLYPTAMTTQISSPTL